MFKALFIPVNSIQAKICAAIIKELNNKGEFSYSVVTSEYWEEPHYRANKTLQELDIPFKNIEEYGTENTKSILEVERPDILVVSQVQSYTVRFFMRACHKRGIPVLLVQDAIFFGEFGPRIRTRTMAQKLKLVASYVPAIIAFIKDRKYTLRQKLQIISMRLKDIIRGMTYIWGHGEYDKVAVIGDYMRQVLISEGIDLSKIVVTGEPRWDELVSSDAERGKVFKELNLDRDKRLILLTTQPMVEDGQWTKEARELWLSSIIQAVNSLSGCQFVVKLHPRDHSEPYEEILREQNAAETVIRQDFDTPRLLKTCDVLLTGLCTTALEAMIVDKPVIIVDFKEDPCRAPFVSSGAAIGVHQPEKLAPTIEKALHDQLIRQQLENARREFVYHHAYIQDGQASKRVADLIIQMIEESRKGKVYA